jgi:hypothetical protein
MTSITQLIHSKKSLSILKEEEDFQVIHLFLIKLERKSW